MDSLHVRRMWKPLVVPNMTWDVGVHGFNPRCFRDEDGAPTGGWDEIETAGDKLSGVWCPCIHHGLEAAEAAKRLDEKGRASQCHTPAAGPGK